MDSSAIAEKGSPDSRVSAAAAKAQETSSEAQAGRESSASAEDQPGSAGTPEGKKEEAEAEPEFEVDGQKVPLSELQKAYTLVDQARAAIEEANELSTTASQLLEGVKKDFAGTLIHYLAATLYKGDEQKGYEHLLREAGALVGKYIKWKNMPPEQREAVTAKQQLERANRRAEEAERKLREQEDLSDELDEGEKLLSELKPVMKKLGLPLTPRMYETVSDILRRLEERYLETGRAEYRPPLESVVRLVRNRLSAQVAEGLKTLPTEELLRLRPDLEQDVNQRTIARVRQNGSVRTPKVGGQPSPQKPAEKPVKVFRDFSDLFPERQ